MRKRLFEAWPSKETSSWWDAGARLSLPFYRTSCTSGWWHRLAFDRFLPPASRNRPTYLAPVQPLLWPQNLFPTAYGTPGSPGSLVTELSFPFSCREPDRVYRRKLDYIESHGLCIFDTRYAIPKFRSRICFPPCGTRKEFIPSRKQRLGSIDNHSKIRLKLGAQ